MEELEKGISEITPGSVISRLWRLIVVKDGYLRYITPRMNDYINKLCIKSELSNTKIGINKTNIYNKIVMTSMTWKNFIFLLKDIIGVKGLEITLVIKYSDREVKFSKSGLDKELLSKLWKDIKEEIIKTDANILDKLSDEYVLRNKDNISATNKTNLSKKISATNAVSWNTIVFLIDEVLKAESMTLIAKVEHTPNRFTSHTLGYYIGKKD